MLAALRGCAKRVVGAAYALWDRGARMGGAARAWGPRRGPRHGPRKKVLADVECNHLATRSVPARVRLRTLASMERADANPRPPIASAKDFGQVRSRDSQSAAQRPRVCVRPLTPRRARTTQLVPFGDPVRPACARAARDRRGAPLPGAVGRCAAVALYLARLASGARACDVARTSCCDATVDPVTRARPAARVLQLRPARLAPSC